MVLVFRRKSSIFWESRLSGPAVRGLAGRGWGQMAYFEFAEGAGGTPALPVGVCKVRDSHFREDRRHSFSITEGCATGVRETG